MGFNYGTQINERISRSQVGQVKWRDSRGLFIYLFIQRHLQVAFQLIPINTGTFASCIDTTSKNVTMQNINLYIHQSQYRI